MTDKTVLRKKFIALRDSLSNEYRSDCDSKIAERLISSDEYALVDKLFIYVSAKNEIETFSIINRALYDGKKVAVPYCSNKTMNFYYIESVNDLKCVQFGIPTIDISKASLAVPDENSLCIVPALSFDKQGNRLGYGGGYYDRFLSENKIKSVGLCRDISIADSLPAEDFDVKINYIITDRSVIKKEG